MQKEIKKNLKKSKSSYLHTKCKKETKKDPIHLSYLHSKCKKEIKSYTRRMKKNLQKSAILFGTKSNAYLQINCPIFAYSWLFLPILTYLRICSKSPRIYFAFRAKYPCLFLPIFCHLTCVHFVKCR